MDRRGEEVEDDGLVEEFRAEAGRRGTTLASACRFGLGRDDGREGYGKRGGGAGTLGVERRGEGGGARDLGVEARAQCDVPSHAADERDEEQRDKKSGDGFHREERMPCGIDDASRAERRMLAGCWGKARGILQRVAESAGGTPNRRSTAPE